MDEMQGYKQVVADRFMGLSDDEKSMIGSLPGTPMGDALGKLFGPELGDIMGGEPTEQMQEQPQPPVEQQMQRAGLGSR